MNEFTLFILILIIPLISQVYIVSTYSKYRKVRNNKDLTGYDVAREILNKNDLKDLVVIETRGELTDHYDPIRKVIKLSSDIYHNSSIASIAVAAHEVGHALQDKDKYIYNKIRTFLLPLVNLTSKVAYIFLLIGFFAELLNFIEYAIALMIFSLLFQIITLPIEFNASKRAKEELRKLQLFTDKELNGTKKMLTSAAFTYVGSLITTLLNMLRLILIVNNRKK